MSIVNLVEQREQEKLVGDEYRHLFHLLMKTYRQAQQDRRSGSSQLNEKDFIWFDYHEQSRSVRNITPEQFVQSMLIKNPQYSILSILKAQAFLTWLDGAKVSEQKGVFRINCIDCLDRTNNVQLTMGMNVVSMQLESLRKQSTGHTLMEQLREMWINNGDHISRIYTGTGALRQQNKVSSLLFDRSEESRVSL